MIQFNNLSIIGEKYLNIDAQIKDKDCLECTVITAVIIDTQDTYGKTPFQTIYYDEEYDDKGNLTGPKRVQEYIDIDGISDNLYIVTVVSNGEGQSCSPCVAKKQITGATFVKDWFLHEFLSKFKSVEDCDFPRDVLNLCLKYLYFKTAIKTNHIEEAIEIWKTMFKKSPVGGIYKSCGCHG